MAGTFPIALQTLTVGTHDVGPAALALPDSLATVTVDRTVAGGLNSLTAATIVQLEIWVSLDGGVSWIEVGRGGLIGGLLPILPMFGGGVQLSSSITYHLPNVGQSREAKASIVVSGTSVAVSGSLVIA